MAVDWLSGLHRYTAIVLGVVQRALSSGEARGGASVPVGRFLDLHRIQSRSQSQAPASRMGGVGPARAEPLCLLWNLLRAPERGFPRLDGRAGDPAGRELY